MVLNQKKAKSGRSGGNLVPPTTIRLSEDVRSALVRLMSDGSSTSLNAVVCTAILAADKSASEKRVASPLAQLQGVTERNREDIIAVGKRLEQLFELSRSIEKDEIRRDERDFEQVTGHLAAMSEQLGSLQQGVEMIVGAVVALGLGHQTEAQNHAWLKTFTGCKGSYERGLLGAQLAEAVAKLSK